MSIKFGSFKSNEYILNTESSFIRLDIIYRKLRIIKHNIYIYIYNKMRGLLVIILELEEELVNVRVDFARLLLIDEVSYSFHNDDFLQRGNVSFEATIIMNVFFHSREMIDQVQIPHYELCWHLHLCSSPCCCQLPCSAFFICRKKSYW